MPEHTAAEQVRRQLGVKTFPVRNRVLSQVGLAVVTIARQDPSRIVLRVNNLSVNILTILDDRNVSAARGIRVPPSGGSAEIRWDEDGERVAYEWSALAGGAASDVLIEEVLISTEGPGGAAGAPAPGG